jgi:hypothetical protein
MTNLLATYSVDTEDKTTGAWSWRRTAIEFLVNSVWINTSASSYAFRVCGLIRHKIKFALRYWCVKRSTCLKLLLFHVYPCIRRACGAAWLKNISDVGEIWRTFLFRVWSRWEWNCIRKIRGWNVGPETGKSDWCFLVLPQFLPSDSDKVRQIRQGQLPSISLPNRLFTKHPVIWRCVFGVVESFAV